jgi:two-component system cell cycle sensor histidine kinase/response regulator CckA
LLAEDLDLLRQALATLLEDEGHAVTAVADGEDALAAVRAGGAFDVVLSDVVMPRLDGHGLRRAIAELAPTLPIILMSGYAHEREIDGPAWLDKPFSREDLRNALSAIASSRARAG